MKTFYVIKNKDAADPFISALESAYYQRTHSSINADFMLIDCEHGGNTKTMIFEYAKSRPVFVYPHTPYSYFIWDGIYDSAPVACNFVVGQGAVMGMKSYGYPYRVEPIGWTGCKIFEFSPTRGTRLVFAPPHLLGNGKYPRPEQFDLVKNTARFIANYANMFESIIVSCAPQSIMASGLDDLIDQPVEWEYFDAYKATKYPRIHAQTLIRDADLVISSGTFGYFSVAQGTPTVMLGYRDMIPGTAGGQAKHYDLYKSHFAFPLTIEAMRIEDVLAVRTKRNESVEEWKRLNIGKPFDKEKFISIVKEYV